MHWILQTNLFREPEWDQLVGALTRFRIPHSVHKVVPFIGELVPATAPENDRVVCFGSYSLRHAAVRHGWNPGVYDLFSHDFVAQKAAWGERLLNFDSNVVAFRDARLPEDAFVRPIDDSKYFAGRVFSPEEFHAWQHQVCNLNLDFGTSLTPDTMIQVCVPKPIHAEYRFWIVGGRIVTKSLYKRGHRVVYSPEVDERLDGFVRDAVADWQPHRAFVIDVCDTPDGPRIVEINTLNSAGFYAGDVQKIVLALEELEHGTG